MCGGFSRRLSKESGFLVTVFVVSIAEVTGAFVAYT
jgi:hypothetical protein